jgi:hypothetical protein
MEKGCSRLTVTAVANGLTNSGIRHSLASRPPYKTCGRSNPTVRSSWDNVSSPDPGGRASREGTRRLLAPGRSGTRVDGRANSGELLINVVRTNKPKALTGLDQKVCGQVQEIPLPLPSLPSHRRTGRASTIHDTSVERGQPVVLPSG